MIRMCNIRLCADKSFLGYWWRMSLAYQFIGVGIMITHVIFVLSLSWWRHQMETFSALLTLCAGNSPVNGDFPAQRPVTRSFDVFFDLHPNKRLSKQSRGSWFKTPSCPWWRHCNVRLLHSPRLVLVCNIVTGDTGWNNGTVELVNRNIM